MRTVKRENDFVQFSRSLSLPTGLHSKITFLSFAGCGVMPAISTVTLATIQQHTLQKRIYTNNQIRANQVRLIDETGKQLGVVPLQEGLQLARERNLDLIQVTEKVEPPVCKIGEYGKYLYQLEKKAREIKKPEGGELKEVRLTFTISEHDLETRVKQAEKFLQKGHRIRLTMRLKGRQNALEGYAREKVQKFLSALEQKTPVKMERELKKEPRGLSAIIAKK